MCLVSANLISHSEEDFLVYFIQQLLSSINGKRWNDKNQNLNLYQAYKEHDMENQS